MQGEFKWSN